MVEIPVSRWSKRRVRERLFAAVLEYAERGWPACPGAHLVRRGPRACSCDRVGCPSPGGHPLSPAWQLQASAGTDQIEQWWSEHPDANIVLPTGRVFDVFDVPAAAGVIALARMGRSKIAVGPVAACGADRHLFFVATRAPEDEDEWWSCHLDSHPDVVPDTPGLRWHCRDSYVLAPPSVLASGHQVCWIRRPGDRPLPDPLQLLEVLVDVCDELDGRR